MLSEGGGGVLGSILGLPAFVGSIQVYRRCLQGGTTTYFPMLLDRPQVLVAVVYSESWTRASY
jgi:hypothetical protein